MTAPGGPTAASYDALDPRTPVVIGVGQYAEQVGAPAYEGLSGVDLAARAAVAALADTGAAPAAVAALVDTVGGIRQFEISVPGMSAPLGRSSNYPRSVARRVGADPARAILEVSGGQGPQHLLSELAGTIAEGAAEVVLIFGSEAISTARHFVGRDDAPDFSEQVDGQLEDRGYGLEGVSSPHRAAHGLVDAPSTYALFENARRARRGEGRAAYARGMGELFAPFTRVAATNPFAAAPVERSAEELATVTERNRMIAEPYPRFLVSRDQVNQGAAVVLTSVAAARRLGVPVERWVFLHGHADTFEREMMRRPELDRAPSAVLAVQEALAMAGIGLAEVSTFDLYSCFPIAVTNVLDGLGLRPDDPRGLTLTGGLPFFGGAGNNYSMHAIAETVARCRTAAGSFGVVGANGGSLSKYSVGVYSTTPVGWHADTSAALQARIDAVPDAPQVERADGWARVESWTVRHTREGRVPVVVGRLEDSGERFVAMGGDDDGPGSLLALLALDQPVGERVFVRSTGPGNRVAVSPDRIER